MIRDFARRALIAALVFLPMPVIGTMLHELGHAAAAFTLGLTSTVHYGSMDSEPSEADREVQRLWEEHGWAMRADTTSPHWDRYRELRVVTNREGLRIILGGPISNMLIGTAGLILLILRRRKRRDDPIDGKDPVAVLAALFWSREAFILTTSIPGMLSGAVAHSDEFRIAAYLHLPFWSVTILLGIMGFAACLATMFMLRKRDRLPLITGGIAGCAVGYLLWYRWLGPILLP